MWNYIRLIEFILTITKYFKFYIIKTINKKISIFSSSSLPNHDSKKCDDEKMSCGILVHIDRKRPHKTYSEVNDNVWA